MGLSRVTSLRLYYNTRAHSIPGWAAWEKGSDDAVLSARFE